MSLPEQKQRLRKQLLAARAFMGTNARAEAARIILELIEQDPDYRRAQTVLAYSGFGTEINTRPFLEHTLQLGKTLVLPRVDKAERALKLYRVADLAALQPDPWGILEPTPVLNLSIGIDAIDWALVPGLGFDTQCNRLGYGARYYDGLFGNAQRRGAALPKRVSGAFACQIVERIPMAEYDLPVDSIVTELARYHRAR